MNMKYETHIFCIKDPPEKMMQNDLGINSIALLTGRFMYLLFFMKHVKNKVFTKKIRLKK